MASQLDFRRLDEGLGGQRNKRKRAAEEKAQEGGGRDGEEAGAMEIEEEGLSLPSAKRPAIAHDGGDRPVFGRPTYDGTIAGKLSGRKWKNPKSARTSSIKVSLRKPSLEQRNRQREIKKAYQARMSELKEHIRQNKISKRKIKEEREKRKKENVARTGTVYQKVSNPKKLKNMSKKQKKMLKVIPD